MKKEKKNLINKELVKEIETKLESMQLFVMTHKLTGEQFQTYYALIKTAMELKVIKNPIPYLLSLSNAPIFVTTEDEYQNAVRIKEYITDELAKTVRDFIGDEINDLYTLNDIQVNSRLSFKQFCDYCDKFKLAVTTKFEEVDIKKIALNLYRAKIDDLNSYYDYQKYNDYRKFLIFTYEEIFSKEREAWLKGREVLYRKKEILYRI